jgi:hypothetical protein
MDMYLSDDSLTERWLGVVGLFAYMRGLCVARPTKMGICQGLNAWDEQWLDTPRFFSIVSICPTAGVSVEHTLTILQWENYLPQNLIFTERYSFSLSSSPASSNPMLATSPTMDSPTLH